MTIALSDNDEEEVQTTRLVALARNPKQTTLIVKTGGSSRMGEILHLELTPADFDQALAKSLNAVVSCSLGDYVRGLF
jgi:hypothetical protein